MERKITARLHSGEKFRQFMALDGWKDLKDAVSGKLRESLYMTWALIHKAVGMITGEMIVTTMFLTYGGIYTVI